MNWIMLCFDRLDSELWTYSLIAFLLSHIIADFGLRGELLGRGRKRPTQRAVYHLLAYVAIAYGLLLLNAPLRVCYLTVLELVVANALVHWLLDVSFARADMWDNPIKSRQRSLFVAQQAIKVFVLVGLATITALYCSPPTSTWHFDPRDWESVRVLAYILGYVFALWVGDAFVSLVLTKLEWAPGSDDGGVPGAGRIIGVFEALLVTTFIIGYQYSAVGLVLTAKSVARFEWLKEQKKTEYFLIGTLSNLVVAILGGFLALWLSGRNLFPKQ